MIEDIRKLSDQYVAWLRDKTFLRQVSDEWVEITTPFLDRHNDYLQIFVKEKNGGYKLTDDGYIIEDLLTSGCKLDSPKRQELLKIALAGFGVKNENGILEVDASENSFSLKKHNLIQAMLAVNDLFYLAMPVVASLFYEDVVLWLDSNDIRYTPSVKFTGTSGFDHHFDFVIPKSRQSPERIVQTISNPNRNNAVDVAFKWIDTKVVRTPDSKAYALLNDIDHKVPSSVIDAIRNWDMIPVPWSEREEVVEELVA